MRLCDRMADRNTDPSLRTPDRLLGDRQELALGITLVLIVTICGQEISALVHPAAGIAVAVCSSLVAVLGGAH